MRIVFDLGGSVIMPKEGANAKKIKEYADVFKKIKDEGHEIAIVVGGGKTAREYISIARELKANNSFCDEIGIMATRMNAMILISALGDYSIKKVPTSFEEAELILNLGKIPVMGGTHPGHTTDAVSASLAEFINADLLVIGTNVDGVYNKDPNKYKDAKKFDKISAKQLVDLALSFSLEAGSSSVIDLLAAKIIERSKLKVIVVKGTPEELLNVSKGIVNGTIIEG
ncbi:UMP kinase [Methanocaldococcus sp.]|uniref:UMP kinase n=1 Tax=Methanocaldococcus sp. TaxID=2152917 RepID=UPI002612BEC5|nr:UMP kinase [Methanocaldococcus sp.]MCQ6253931.1 UMP kinase [Methanocaldococcus sp.]